MARRRTVRSAYLGALLAELAPLLADLATEVAVTRARVSRMHAAYHRRRR